MEYTTGDDTSFWGGTARADGDSHNDIELKSQTADALEWGKAWSEYRTNIGTSYGFTVGGSSKLFRAKVTLKLDGSLENSANGDQYSYFRIQIDLFYESSGIQIVGSKTVEYNDGENFSGSTYTFYTSSGSVANQVLHVKIKFTLYAEGTLGSGTGTIDNDFESGVNNIELLNYYIQRYDWFN